MGNGDRGLGPVQAVKDLLLSLERVVASNAASAAVEGARKELREGLPGLDVELRHVVDDTLVLLERVLHAVAAQEPGTVGTTTIHNLARSATRGALDELERQWEEGGLPFHAFVVRLNALFDAIGDLVAWRAEEIRQPGSRAREMAVNAIDGANQKLRELVPLLAEDLRGLAPVGGAIAHRIGRGLVDGIASKIQENPEVLAPLLESSGRAIVRGVVSGASEVRPKAAGEALRRASHEVVAGALGAVSSALRQPALVLAGAGGAAITAVALLLFRRRRA